LTLYDTKADTWDLMTIVGGPTVDARVGHTAVYAANGQIIVYGGTTPKSELTPTPELAVLDTTTKPFKWITPPVTAPEVSVNSLAYHQANLIGDYMSKTSPTASPNVSPTSTSDSVLSPTMILAIVASILTIAASIGIFLFYRRNRQKKNVQELSSFNDASSPTHSTQMTSSPPPSSQGQINNNDNFMRSISITTSPSLISSSNSQSPSNHNSVFSLLNSNNNLNNKNIMVNPAPTDTRIVHANVIVNNNLYDVGSFSKGQSSKEFFSLVLSQTFDATTPPWKDLTATFPLLVLISWATASSNTNNKVFLFDAVNSVPTDPRFIHATVIVNNNLYVMGGVSNGLPSREFFSLDLSQPFNTTTPPWKDLTTASQLPVFSSWAKASSNAKNDTIFLFGGIMLDVVTGDYNLKSVIYTHDFKSNQWSVNPPAFQGMAPERRREFSSVNDPLTGKLYIHGGVNDMKVTTTALFNDFFILDGNNLSWSQIGKTGLNMPPPRIDHVAVLIANGIIVFIGGRETITPKAPLTALTLYDTKTDTWDLMTTVGGLDIESRIGHTAVYAANGQIIVYGGTTPAIKTTPTPELVVLDTTTKPFKWITPPVTTSEVHNNSLTRNITNKFGPPLKTSNSIQILNIVDYKWVGSFPGLPPPSSTSGDSNSYSGTVAAIVVSVGLTLIIAVLIVTFLVYRRNRQRKDAQGSLLSSNNVSPPLPPPTPSSYSQGQFNNNDNLMRSISTTTPSLISLPNSQSPSNHNSVYIYSPPDLAKQQQLMLGNYANRPLSLLPPTSISSFNDYNLNSQQFSNIMDPNSQSGLEIIPSLSTPDLNNLAIDG
ncbi:15253_t:CDS:10, partial [Entrophospora sp. SA101]